MIADQINHAREVNPKVRRFPFSSPMESLASQARPAAVLWLAGFFQAARLHRVVSFCASSRALSIRIAQCFLLNGLIFLGRYNDIAKHALDVVKSKSLVLTQSLDAHNITETKEQPEGFDRVALGIGEQVYSILLLTIFFVEVSVIGYIPYFGKAMNFLLLSLMYAYYCFEYKWNFFAVSLHERLDFFESNWAFFAGFGMLAIYALIGDVV
ncbi:Protein EI24-like protein [Zea mays]|uniref:Protein EI24-like protein n=1 Tax=Zea mays TaxID=4577 RepID=A0A1D6EAJ2_MAIZE|nr:Protein EI24-like protein [Zea mays]